MSRTEDVSHNCGVESDTRESISRSVQEVSCGGELGLEVTLHLGGAVVVEGGTVVESLVRGQGLGEGGSKGHPAQEAVHHGRIC